MKRLSLLILLSLFIICGCGKVFPVRSSTDTPDQVNYIQLAVSAADKLSSKQFSDLRKMFDPDLMKTLSEDELKWAWTQLQTKLGDFQYYSSDFTVANVNNTMIANVPFTFETNSINVRFSFNQAGAINGLYFDSSTANQKISPRLPNDHEVLIGTSPWILSGSLTLPAGEEPFPAVILVHGSGPSDRNAQIGPNLPFYDLAAQLSERGIAVLRYDKRTYSYGNEILMDNDITINDEVIDDVLAAYQLLIDTSTIDPEQIYIAGHGLGGMVIPLIADNLPDAAGFIVMAASARSIPDTIDAQAEYIISSDDSITAENKATLLLQAHTLSDNLRTLTIDSDLTTDDLQGAPASYWVPLLAYDHTSAMKNITKPLLFIQGGRDYQSTEGDLTLWKQSLQGHTNAEFKLYGNLNHLFMPGVGKSKPAEYQTKNTVSETVSEDIADFVNANNH